MATPDELWTLANETLIKKAKKAIQALLVIPEGIQKLVEKLVDKSTLGASAQLRERLYVIIDKLMPHEPSNKIPLIEILSKLGTSSEPGSDLRIKTLLLRHQHGDGDAIGGIQKEFQHLWNQTKDSKVYKKVYADNKDWTRLPKQVRVGILELIRSNTNDADHNAVLDAWIKTLNEDINYDTFKAITEPINELKLPVGEVALPPIVTVEPPASDVSEPPLEVPKKKPKAVPKESTEASLPLLGDQLGIGSIVAAIDTLGQRIEKLFAPKTDSALAERITRLEQAKSETERAGSERIREELANSVKQIDELREEVETHAGELRRMTERAEAAERVTTEARDLIAAEKERANQYIRNNDLDRANDLLTFQARLWDKLQAQLIDVPPKPDLRDFTPKVAEILDIRLRKIRNALATENIPPK